MQTNRPSPALVEQYRRQMLEMQQSTAASSPQSTADNWLDDRFPEPHFDKDHAAMEIPAATTPPIAETPYIGYLRVFTYTANEAEPIPDAHITVSRDGVVYANTVTDRDGFTAVIPLPTVNPALTLKPGAVQPYQTYSIRITAPGFRTALHDNVPLYGNTYVTQPVALLPLLPDAEDNAPQRFVSDGPAKLQGGE